MPQAVVQGTKRDRGLSHRGQNSLVLERAAELLHEEKNSSQGFHTLTVEVFLEDFTYSNPLPLPLPVSVHTFTGPCPDPHLFHSRSGYTESSHEFQDHGRDK